MSNSALLWQKIERDRAAALKSWVKEIQAWARSVKNMANPQTEAIATIPITQPQTGCQTADVLASPKHQAVPATSPNDTPNQTSMVNISKNAFIS